MLRSSDAFLQELSGTEIRGETDHPTEQAGIGHKSGFQLLSWSKHDQEYTRFAKWRLREGGEESCKLSLSSTSHRESWGCLFFPPKVKLGREESQDHSNILMGIFCNLGEQTDWADS